MSLAESLKTESFDEVKALFENGAQFNIENLVFEGGGAKGMFYIGAIKVLEDLGILRQLRRFAGTSVGSIAAGILAIGGNTQDVERIFVQGNVAKLVYDSKMGKLSLVPNVLKKYGWNPADRLVKALHKLIKEKTGRDDITFMELYKEKGVELCTVASNLSTMTPEYCHPKTTPDMSIALAIRSSASLPGWFLSMKKEDSFFHRLGSDEPPFQTFNEKTLGIVLFSAQDHRLMKGELHKQASTITHDRPKTKLAISRGASCDKAIASVMHSQQMMDAGSRFLQALSEADLDRDGKISLQEFKAAFVQNHKLDEKDGKLLFGDSFDIEKAFDELDTDENGELTADEFLSFMQKRGVAYRAMMSGGGCFIPVRDFAGFFSSALNTISVWTGMAFANPRDMERTLAIFTDYIRVTDFNMEQADKAYALKVGMETTLSYIKNKVRDAVNGKQQPDESESTADGVLEPGTGGQWEKEPLLKETDSASQYEI